MQDKCFRIPLPVFGKFRKVIIMIIFKREWAASFFIIAALTAWTPAWGIEIAKRPDGQSGATQAAPDGKTDGTSTNPAAPTSDPNAQKPQTPQAQVDELTGKLREAEDALAEQRRIIDGLIDQADRSERDALIEQLRQAQKREDQAKQDLADAKAQAKAAKAQQQTQTAGAAAGGMGGGGGDKGADAAKAAAMAITPPAFPVPSAAANATSVSITPPASVSASAPPPAKTALAFSNPTSTAPSPVDIVQRLSNITAAARPASYGAFSGQGSGSSGSGPSYGTAPMSSQSLMGVKTSSKKPTLADQLVRGPKVQRGIASQATPSAKPLPVIVMPTVTLPQDTADDNPSAESGHKSE